MFAAVVLAVAGGVCFLLAAFGVAPDGVDLTRVAFALWMFAFAASWLPAGWAARNRG